ncbi:DUF2334 domain-containing protein [Rhodococcus rhodnii]|uniref:Deacetylase n=2 Tax=Rhodococcus rhodnii TaxID=38312 RepID=R7WK93_9NOCA|nr:DUF2334 domain-containing protein [Rhodococcus rhodnii]EOM74414.1 hypothetical protein Rrhod_4216 [Rhodococcus rhodnii LMG 5362]TXG89125.1 DUF2334 domain-containing protein [Rhodococcus rhodnii]
MTAQLIVSVSGIRALTRSHAETFAAEMDERGVPLSLFVAPRAKEHYRLVRDDATQDWLRQRRAHGDAIVLHGYDQAATSRRRAEFAALSRHEALLRLGAADRVLEHAGLRTRLFAAPRWNLSSGALAALPAAGFRTAVTANGTLDTTTCELTRTGLLSIGAGSATEPWWCRAVVLSAERRARRGNTVRLAVTATQLGRSGPRRAVLDAVDLALHHGTVPAVYAWEKRLRRAA